MARKSITSVGAEELSSGNCSADDCARALYGAPPYCPYCGTRQPEPVPAKPEPLKPEAARTAPPPDEVVAPGSRAITATPTPAQPQPPAPPPATPARTSAPVPAAPPSNAAKAGSSVPTPLTDHAPSRPVAPRIPIPPQSPPTPNPKPKSGCGAWILRAFGVLILIAIVRSCWPSASGDEVTQYVNRPVNVRTGPSDGDRAVAQLPRGDELTGRWVKAGDTVTWLEITKGLHSGSFVWGKNLSSERRPQLESLIGRRQKAFLDGVVSTEPNADSPSAATLSAGDTLNAVGTTLTGWVEVTLPTGGVGYVREEVFRSGPRGEAWSIPAPTSADVPSQEPRGATSARQQRPLPPPAPTPAVSQAVPPPAYEPNLVTCILPSADEVKLSLQRCRERGGVVY